MSVQPADDGRGNSSDRRGASLEISREEHLRRARPLPPLEEMAIEDLTDEEWEGFWAAINDL